MSILDRIFAFLCHRQVDSQLDEPTLVALTAFHEAAHAVLAHVSQFYSLIGYIQLYSRDIGDTYVSLSRRKLAQAGKPTDISVLVDPDIVQDGSLIYLAGYASEKHYYRIILDRCTQLPDRSYPENDYAVVRQLIENAGFSSNILSGFEVQASNSVEQRWHTIELLASMILRSENRTLDAIDAIEFLDRLLGTNSWG